MKLRWAKVKASSNRRAREPGGTKRTYKNVTDGTGWTYLLGEKSPNPLPYRSGTGQGDDKSILSPTPEIVTGYAFRVPGPDRENECFECHDFGCAHRSGGEVLLIGHVLLLFRLRHIDGDFDATAKN